MTTLRLVLGDQLSTELSALADIDPAHDVVLMLEVEQECRYVPHHQQKIVLFLSAMRHFGQELRRRGIQVDYVRLDDRANTGTLTSELERALNRHRPQRLVLTEPGEWRVQTMAQTWSRRLGLPVELRADSRFFAARNDYFGGV